MTQIFLANFASLRNFDPGELDLMATIPIRKQDGRSYKLVKFVTVQTLINESNPCKTATQRN